MILEISNPSDKATINCHNLLAARIAVLLLGGGRYGIIDDAGDNGMPTFIFGGVDEWMLEHHAMTFEQAFRSIPKDELVKALLSIKLCGERTSMNDFTERAHKIASEINEQKTTS